MKSLRALLLAVLLLWNFGVTVALGYLLMGVPRAQESVAQGDSPTRDHSPQKQPEQLPESPATQPPEGKQPPEEVGAPPVQESGDPVLARLLKDSTDADPATRARALEELARFGEVLVVRDPGLPPVELPPIAGTQTDPKPEPKPEPKPLPALNPGEKVDLEMPIKRDPFTRRQALMAHGGTAGTEVAVALGLEWLANHQAPDGSWSLQKYREHGRCNCTGLGSKNNDVAATAFGLLPLMGAGHTHKPILYPGQVYAKHVDKGLRWLVMHQDREGGFNPHSGEMYSHSIATIALCEGYGLTGDPALQQPAQRAVNFLLRAQTPQGGWRYRPKSTGFDGSIGGWAMSALATARRAGLEVPAESLQRAGKWLDAAAAPDGGRFGYTDPHPANGFRPGTSAEGLLSRLQLGWQANNPALLSGLNFMRAHKFHKNDMYYSFPATQIFFHLGGQNWMEWNKSMRDELVAAQDNGGMVAHQRGSFYDPLDRISSGHGGRLMQTSLSLLTLETYYREPSLFGAGIVTEPPKTIDPKLKELLTALENADEGERVKAASALKEQGLEASAASHGLCQCLARSKTEAARQAALEALEVVNPPLYKPIVQLRRTDPFEQAIAFRMFSEMGKAAQPAMPLLVQVLAEDKQRLFTRDIVRIIAAVQPNDPDVDRALVELAKPPVDADLRLEAQRLAGSWATTRAELRQDMVPVLVGVLTRYKDNAAIVPEKEVVQALYLLGRYGNDAESALPLIKPLVDSEIKAISEAATAALVGIKP